MTKEFDFDKILHPGLNPEPDPLKKEAKKEVKKEPKKVANPPPKRYFDVKVECMLPAVLTYRVLAEDEHEAAKLIKGKTPNSVQHKLMGRKELMIRVFDAGSSMMRLMKKVLG